MKIRYSDEVKCALIHKMPVVALESTIISHGMPYPDNVKTALACEKIIRDNGAVPATIAIVKGEIVIGLSENEINYIGKEGHNVYKTSRRDIPYVVSKKLNGATTVSATMILADMAGIRFFATGGIGGVHRKAEVTMDISADLEELAQTNVCVVCAGAKAILDLEKTLEYLETKGVPVIGYQTDNLPAFYTATSPYHVNFRFDDVSEIAKFCNTKWDLNINGGVLVTNPIPVEDALDEKIMNEAIEKALLEMESLGIKGKETTPYLLAKVVEITSGKSLAANISLVYNNCVLASKIAQSYSKGIINEEKNN